MNSRRNQQGFSHIIILSLLSVVFIFIAVFTAYRILPNSGSNDFNNLLTKAKKICSNKESVKLCVKVPKSSLGYAEKTSLTATLATKGSKSYSWSGSSSCGGKATLTINGKPTLLICTDDIQSFEIGPGQTETQTLELNGADLQQGSNVVEVNWAGVTSQKISFMAKAPTKADTAKASSCFGGDDKPICANINVIMKDGYYSDKSTCHDLAKYFESLKIKPQDKYCDLGNIGIVYFIVPKPEAHHWREKLAAIPEVKQASISD